MYASLGTCPDITYAIQMVSHFSKNPGQAHWEAVKQIFCYLKGTKDFWLTYGGQQKELRGYADADGSMAKDRHAISGYAFLLNGGAVSWATKWQEIVSLSTTESEYVAVMHASKEVLWLRSLITSGGKIRFSLVQRTISPNLELNSRFGSGHSAEPWTEPTVQVQFWFKLGLNPLPWEKKFHPLLGSIT